MKDRVSVCLCLVVARPGKHRRPMSAQVPPKKKRVSVKKALITTFAVLIILAILAVAAYFSEYTVTPC